jgi:hypothetical protein
MKFHGNDNYVVWIQFATDFKADRFVAVLEIPPVVSAETAVRVQIVKDFKRGK